MLILLCGENTTRVTPAFTAGSPAEAYELLKRHGEAVVLVTFPEEQGVEFAVTAARLYRNKKFLLVTARGLSYQQWVELEQAGVTPVHPDDVEMVLGELSFRPRPPVPVEAAVEEEKKFLKRLLKKRAGPPVPPVSPGNADPAPPEKQAADQSVQRHTAVYVVCPSRPAAAGETAVSLARQVDGAALVCAAANSTAALAAGIPLETLITADWRVPGSTAPVKVGSMYVWPVDPLKLLDTQEPVHALVEKVRNHFSVVVVDCGGSLELCTRVKKTDRIVVLRMGEDLTDKIVQHWLDSYGTENVSVFGTGERPELVATGNSLTISKGKG